MPTPTVLRRRAEMLAAVRGFFAGRGFLEVETPAASREAVPEEHIDLYHAEGLGWLQASPEMHHKRLLCAGVGPLFEVARSYRRGERGVRHAAEFTLVEWYEPGATLGDAMALTDALLATVCSAPAARRTTYRDALHAAFGVDPHTAGTGELAAAADSRGVDRAGLTTDDPRDEWLNVLLAARVEPGLGRGGPEFLVEYPATQAALAEVRADAQGVPVAARFELYWRGVELANGYQELTDPVELRDRLERANVRRAARGDRVVPLPERLLAEMASPGLPRCAGVALGFDRLVMLAVGAESIAEVRAFAGED